MRLFILDEGYQVDLNKEWLYLIPEFSFLIKRDKGSAGDYRGDKKLKARREFTFIYFDLDFTSPIREWEDFERRQEAMRYAGLTEADLDGPVMEAHALYNQLLLKSSRSLKTLQAIEKSLDAMDDYFNTIDFSAVDKKGEILHDPAKYILNLQRIGAAYDSVDKFRKRVQEELKGETSIRGTATLGRKETAGMGEWKEETAAPAAASVSFNDIGQLLRGIDDEDEKEEDI